jgi:hypothetical protein
MHSLAAAVVPTCVLLIYRIVGNQTLGSHIFYNANRLTTAIIAYSGDSAVTVGGAWRIFPRPPKASPFLQLPLDARGTASGKGLYLAKRGHRRVAREGRQQRAVGPAQFHGVGGPLTGQ